MRMRVCPPTKCMMSHWCEAQWRVNLMMRAPSGCGFIDFRLLWWSKANLGVKGQNISLVKNVLWTFSDVSTPYHPVSFNLTFKKSSYSTFSDNFTYIFFINLYKCLIYAEWNIHTQDSMFLWLHFLSFASLYIHFPKFSLTNLVSLESI